MIRQRHLHVGTLVLLQFDDIRPIDKKRTGSIERRRLAVKYLAQGQALADEG
jgi:hypothetical protein